MNIRHVDLNLLVYLNVLIDEQSVSKAANKLALTQPAMSNALKRLRDLFDDPLLVRAAGTMTPTAKALSLKPEIESLLKMAEEIMENEIEFVEHQAPKRPDILECDIYQSCIKGEDWTILVGLLNGKPYEVIGGLSRWCAVWPSR